MYLLCATTALIYYALSVHLLSVVRLYSRSSPASLLVCFGSLFSQFQTFLIIFALAFLFRSSRLISLSLSFVTTGSVTWAAWISASAFCPSCVPRRKRRRNEGKNRIQICRRSRRRYNAKQKEKKKKNDDDEECEHDENKNSENNNNNRVTSSSTRRRKRFSQACSRV